MLKFTIASVDSFVITFSESIDLDISEKIKFYFNTIKKIDDVIDVIPSYTTILVTFDIFKKSSKELESIILDINYKKEGKSAESKTIEIPTYYGKEVGLDLERISQLNKITIDEIINIHSSKIYNVFTIGFAPGFAYLGEVDKRIATPRLDSPRKLVQKGSVSIADTQTAIYPQNSPGGWNVIGMTTFNMFDKNLKELCPFSMGDKVRFKSISKEEYISLGGAL